MEIYQILKLSRACKHHEVTDIVMERIVGENGGNSWRCA